MGLDNIVETTVTKKDVNEVDLLGEGVINHGNHSKSSNNQKDIDLLGLDDANKEILNRQENNQSNKNHDYDFFNDI